ncbi:hypothetical protein KJZ99_00135 [bacterium]|nr:hypothetical protein [bacterium]
MNRLTVGLIFLTVFIPSVLFSRNGPAMYYADGAVTGLTIKFVSADSCTGTPPSVTINGGVVGHTLSDMGGGAYWKDIPEGMYHVFQSSTWKAKTYVISDSAHVKLAAVDSNNWVTSDRLAGVSVTESKLAGNSVSGAKVSDGSLNSADIANTSLYWLKLHTTVKGSADTTYDLGEMQTDLTGMKGNWNSGTDYHLGAIDSIVKGLIGTSFSSAACSLTVTGSAVGVRAFWYMNSAANYDAVNYYDVFAGEIPYLHAAGAMDSLSYATLQTGMNRVARISSPGRLAQTYFVNWPDSVYVVIVATDYAGNMVSSGWKVGRSGMVSPGFSSDLAGNPFYAQGQNLADVLTVMGNELATVSAVSSAVSKPKILVYNWNSTAAAGYDQDAAVYGIHRSSADSGEGPKYPIRFGFVKHPGYTRATLSVKGRMQSIGEKGYVQLDMGGNQSIVTVGGLSTAQDTTTKMYTVTVSLLGLTDDEVYEGNMLIWVGNTADSLSVHLPTVWME